MIVTGIVVTSSQKNAPELHLLAFQLYRGKLGENRYVLIGGLELLSIV